MLDQTPTVAMAHASPFSESDVLAFYLSFTPAERRARFKVHADDGYIRRWRATIDSGHYWAAGLDVRGRLLGLVELFGANKSGWERPELAASFPASAGLSPLLAEALIDRGIHAAQTLGACEVVMWLDGEHGFSCFMQKRWAAGIAPDLGAAMIRLS